jgi:hypothetical protein
MLNADLTCTLQGEGFCGLAKCNLHLLIGRYGINDFLDVISFSPPPEGGLINAQDIGGLLQGLC